MANKKGSGQVEHSMETMSDECLGALITVFEPVLLKKLRVSHLLCLLDIEEVKKVSAAIHKTENNGHFSKACKDLLDAIRRATEPGKWRMFVDALSEMNESAVLSVLLEEKLCGESDSEWIGDLQNSKLIHIFSRSIEDHLNLDHLLPTMYQKGLIIQEEMETLFAQIQSGKRWDANVCFLFYVHRHLKDWYKVFLEILFEDEHHKELVKEIDEEEYNKLKKKHERSIITDDDDELQRKGAASVDTSAEGGQFSARHCKRSANLVSLTQKDVGDKSLPLVSRKYHSARAGPEGASCGCGCCEQVMAELLQMRTQVASLPELKTQIASLTSELHDMKDLLLKALKRQ